MRKFVILLSFLILIPLLTFSQSMNIGLARAAASEVRQQALGTEQLTGPRMQLVRQRTGLSQDQIVKLYNASGAKNFGQFVCAMLAAQQLKVDSSALLEQLRTGCVREGLVRMGVDRERSRVAVRAALDEMVAARKSAA